MSSPATAGPTMRAPLNTSELRATALARSGLPTRSRDIGLTRRDVDRAAQPVDQREDSHVPVPDLPGPDEQGQRERLHHHRRLGQQDDPPLREAVAHGAADGRQDEDGGELQRGHQPELNRRSRQLQDEPRLAHALHPGSDQRDELSAPEEPEVSVPERRQPRRLRRRRGLHRRHARDAVAGVERHGRRVRAKRLPRQALPRRMRRPRSILLDTPPMGA